jgi:hypothetical protein
MAVNQRRRQKKLAKKKAKRKAAKKTAGRSDLNSFLGQAPIYETLVPKNLFEIGIGTVVFSREMPDGSIASASFLLDVYCLGIKDAHLGFFPRSDYIAMIQRMEENQKFEKASPEYIHKLVEESAAYARAIGFAPHKGYAKAKRVFGAADASDYTLTFEFGKEGKPFFVAGPHDSPSRCNKIRRTLVTTCGEDGFNFLIPASDGEKD